MKNVLIIDDEPVWCKLIRTQAEALGCKAEVTYSLDEGLELIERKSWDLVFLDVHIPDGDGLAALPTIQDIPSKPLVIIITGKPTEDAAALAIKHGAWNYIVKNTTGVAATVALNIERALLFREQHRVRPVCLRLEGVVGSSQRFSQCLDKVAEAAHGESSVLVLGETGTGKERIAAMIHANSVRKDMPFVTVDCAALSDQLLESALFGHRKGAFTGAYIDREGLIAQAHGGTLFLDEVGELSLPSQKTFLRVLQERSFRQVGGNREISVDFRVIAATNRDIEAMVDRGEFRQDLYYRLEGFRVELPPLRKRKEDIRDIADYHIRRICSKLGVPRKGASSDFFEELEAYNWPGNVRELVNAVESAISKGFHGHILFAYQLPEPVRLSVLRDSVRCAQTAEQSQRVDAGRPVGTPADLPFKEYRNQVVAKAQRTYVLDLMRKANGNMQLATQISGLSRTRIYQLLAHSAGKACSGGS